MINLMTAEQVLETAKRLDKLADEIKTTAEGSSRIQMYTHIANTLHEEAKELRKAVR